MQTEVAEPLCLWFLVRNGFGAYLKSIDGCATARRIPPRSAAFQSVVFAGILQNVSILRIGDLLVQFLSYSYGP